MDTKQTTAPAPTFESTACTRCGGGGKFSFNMMHGDRCYGCQGTGLKLTKRGEAARKWLEQRQMKPISEINVGDNVFTSCFLEQNRWWFVKASERTENGQIKLTLVRKGKSHTFQAWDAYALRTVRDEAQRAADTQAALEYQGTLTKAGTPAKKAAKA